MNVDHCELKTLYSSNCSVPFAVRSASCRLDSCNCIVAISLCSFSIRASSLGCSPGCLSCGLQLTVSLLSSCGSCLIWADDVGCQQGDVSRGKVCCDDVSQGKVCCDDVLLSTCWWCCSAAVVARVDVSTRLSTSPTPDFTSSADHKQTVITVSQLRQLAP